MHVQRVPTITHRSKMKCLLMTVATWTIVVVMVVLSGRIVVDGAYIYPGNHIVVQEGLGFLVKLNTDRHYGNVKYCTFLFHGQPYFLHPSNENDGVAYRSVHGELIERFTATECGVKVTNVSRESAGMWQLGATSQSQVDASAAFRLEVVARVPTETGAEAAENVYGRPGAAVTLNCAEGIADDNRHRFCEFDATDGSDSRQRGANDPCSLVTAFPQSESIRRYMCTTFSRGAMGAITRRWILHGQSETSHDSLETDNNIVLRCQAAAAAAGRERDGGTVASIAHCYIRNVKTGAVWQIEDGLQDYRYSTFRTSLEKGRCQFEIPKPIRPEERGLWKMYLGFGGDTDDKSDNGLEYEQCLFTVNDGKAFRI